MSRVFWYDYIIDPKKKYLVYFQGNFSPPHKGHLSLLDKFLNQENIKIIIGLVGDESKHGIPFSISMDIWNIYLSTLKSDIKIFKFDPRYSYLIGKKVDIVLFIRGDENFDKGIVRHQFKSVYTNLNKILRKKGTILDFLFLKRIPEISSTSLCKNFTNLRHYLPDNLSEEDIVQIEKLLSNFLF